jgi:TPR repeat protein
MMKGFAALQKGDYATALKIAKRHTDLSNGQYVLGELYENGGGVLRDYKAAIKWYKKAANDGYTTAKFNLALLYVKGKGTPVDNVRGHMWFNIVTALLDKNAGGDIARGNLDQTEKFMTSSQVETALQLAREWMNTHQQVLNERRKGIEFQKKNPTLLNDLLKKLER